MNILVINYEYPPIGGGGGVICKDIAEEMSATGNNVTVITSMYAGQNPCENRNGVEVVRVPVMMRKDRDVATVLSMLTYVPSCAMAANRLLRRKRFDVVHTHFAIPSGPAGQYITWKHGIPNVLSLHGGDIFDPSKRLSPHRTIGLKQTVRKMVRSADRVVAQSSDTKRNAIAYYDIRRDIDVIPLGIKPNLFPRRSRKDLDLPENVFVFITIGRLVRRKNIDDLLEVTREVGKDIPCLLIIIGDGPEKDSIEKKIRERNMEPMVRMLGRISDERKFQYLSESDAYVSTASHEGFGLVFLEAMECGLPVVCYDRGGQVDFLENGRTGFLIKLDDRKEFAAGLRTLTGSRTLMSEMGIHNRSHVEKFYIRNCANRYLELFEELAGSKRQSRPSSDRNLPS